MVKYKCCVTQKERKSRFRNRKRDFLLWSFNNFSAGNNPKRCFVNGKRISFKNRKVRIHSRCNGTDFIGKTEDFCRYGSYCADCIVMIHSRSYGNSCGKRKISNRDFRMIGADCNLNSGFFKDCRIFVIFVGKFRF